MPVAYTLNNRIVTITRKAPLLSITATYGHLWAILLRKVVQCSEQLLRVTPHPTDGQGHSAIIQLLTSILVGDDLLVKGPLTIQLVTGCLVPLATTMNAGDRLILTRYLPIRIQQNAAKCADKGRPFPHSPIGPSQNAGFLGFLELVEQVCPIFRQCRPSRADRDVPQIEALEVTRECY